jgi:hypothetical protein
MGVSHDTDDGTIDWTADALVMAAGSQWDTSVLVLAEDGTELSRQRFAFTLDDDGIDEGEARSFLDPTLGIAAMLVVGGALGLGLGLGGMRLPRCEAVASRVALLGAGAVAIVLGGVIGIGRLVG